jgi:vitamin B12 transporter
MPTLNDLYYTFVGNVDLDPEYTNQYNLGFTYSKSFSHSWLRYIEVQTDVYYNEVENKIIATPTSNFFRWTMINLGKVEIRGIDAALQTGWQIGREFRLNGRINYTYQKAQDFTDPYDEFYGGQIPYIPWHSGSAAVNANWRSWEANYSFIYTGERYSSQANILANYQLPWYTSDLSVAKTQRIGPGDLKLTLEINNLFNQQYEVVICYPMPGINFKLIAQYTF